MAAKKIYAVKKGAKTGIFETWEACKASVDGYPGAEYRGFSQKEEALAYLGLIEEKKVSKKQSSIEDLPEDEGSVIAYVDGSYEHSLLKYAFGCVFLLADGRVFTEKGSGDNTESAKLRNVTGEMLGAMFAVKWAMKNGYKKITLRYDYEGVEKWVTGVWKSKTELTQKYAKAMQEWRCGIELHFEKVAAHTNVYYNEMADQLAKAALLEPTGVPKMRLVAEMENDHG